MCRPEISALNVLLKRLDLIGGTANCVSESESWCTGRPFRVLHARILRSSPAAKINSSEGSIAIG